MVAQLQPQPEYERPRLRLVDDPYKLDQDVPQLRFEEAHEAFTQGFTWGLAVISLGFWMPVVSALYVWLG
jgi:hypothetical protein